MPDALDNEHRLRLALHDTSRRFTARFTSAEFGRAMGIVIGRARREDLGFASSNEFRDPGPTLSDEQRRLNALVHELDYLREQFPVSIERLRAIGVDVVRRAARSREFRGPTERNLEFHLNDTAGRHTAEELGRAMDIAIERATQRNASGLASSNESRNPAPLRSRGSREGETLAAELDNYMRKFPTSIDRLRSIGNAVIERATQLETLRGLSRVTDLLIDQFSAGGIGSPGRGTPDGASAALDHHIAELSRLRARETDEGHRTRLNDFAARFERQRTQLNTLAARFEAERAQLEGSDPPPSYSDSERAHAAASRRLDGRSRRRRGGRGD